MFFSSYTSKKSIIVISLMLFLCIIGAGCSRTAPPPLQQSPDEFKAECQYIEYSQLVRNPDNFKDIKVIYLGRVVSTQENGNTFGLLVSIPGKPGGLVWVNYTRKPEENRILGGDVIRFWGIVKGVHNYTAPYTNSQATAPEIDGKYIAAATAKELSDAINPPPPPLNPDEFKPSCQYVEYAQLLRNPDSFKDIRLTYMGKVVQVIEYGNNRTGLLINVPGNPGGLIWGNYTKKPEENRILGGDIIRFWGIVKGLRTYSTVLFAQGASPEIDIKFLDFATEKDLNSSGKINIQSTSSNSAPPVPLGPQDYTINGVRLGDHISQVIKRLGEPAQKNTTQSGLVIYTYIGLEVHTNEQGKTTNIIVDQPQIAISRNVKVGSPISEVLSAYGIVFNKIIYSDMDMYEYVLANKDGTKNVLRFAVNQKTNIVTYIGCRIVN